MKTWTIYCAKHIESGKTYVGQTHRSFEQRKKEHIDDSSKERCRKFFHRALRTHGVDAFEWTVLRTDLMSVDEANACEKEFIQKLNSHVSCGGYNLTLGGYGSRGFNHTEETRKKIGDRFRGKPKSTEQRSKMGKAISAALKGKRRGPRKFKNPEQAWKNASEGQKRRGSRPSYSHKEETRAKLRKPKSEITKQRMSDAQKLRRAKEKQSETTGN